MIAWGYQFDTIQDIEGKWANKAKKKIQELMKDDTSQESKVTPDYGTRETTVAIVWDGSLDF